MRKGQRRANVGVLAKEDTAEGIVLLPVREALEELLGGRLENSLSKAEGEEGDGGLSSQFLDELGRVREVFGRLSNSEAEKLWAIEPDRKPKEMFVPQRRAVLGDGERSFGSRR